MHPPLSPFRDGASRSAGWTMPASGWVALEPRDKGIIVIALRMGDEVVSPKDAFATLPCWACPNRWWEIAARSFEQQEGAFERKIRGPLRERTARPDTAAKRKARSLSLRAGRGRECHRPDGALREALASAQEQRQKPRRRSVRPQGYLREGRNAQTPWPPQDSVNSDCADRSACRGRSADDALKWGSDANANRCSDRRRARFWTTTPVLHEGSGECQPVFVSPIRRS